MPSQDIQVPAHEGGVFTAYLAEPANATSVPAVVVVPEIFGVNANIRAITDRYAQIGFIAAAPDIFWRQEAGLGVTPPGPLKDPGR
jgi:carboxymethylenebutenolidase